MNILIVNYRTTAEYVKKEYPGIKFDLVLSSVSDGNHALRGIRVEKVYIDESVLCTGIRIDLLQELKMMLGREGITLLEGIRIL